MLTEGFINSLWHPRKSCSGATSYIQKSFFSFRIGRNALVSLWMLLFFIFKCVLLFFLKINLVESDLWKGLSCHAPHHGPPLWPMMCFLWYLALVMSHPQAVSRLAMGGRYIQGWCQRRDMTLEHSVIALTTACSAVRWGVGEFF